jgi:peptide/nickel transport system permease protein
VASPSRLEDADGLIEGTPLRAQAAVTVDPGLARSMRSAAKNWKGLAGGSILGLVVVVIVGAPLWSPEDPLKVTLRDALMPPLSQGAGGYHLLGTDPLGRDLLTRLVSGGRVSLLIGFLAVAVSAPLGLAAGVVSGYSGGRIDSILMRIIDTQAAIPFILLAVAFVAVLGPNPRNVVLVLGVAGWITFGRVARSEALVLREYEYVQAARAMGASTARIVFFHILPGAVNSAIVIGTFSVGQMIILESTLSFFGLGVQAPTASWGNIMSAGRPYLDTAPWITTFPGVALLVTVLGVNLVGEWLGGASNPHAR